MTPELFRHRLLRTYGPLLARHGTPNEVQLAAAAPLLAGRDVLLTAPTASGKTEAYLAPLCELHCRTRDEAPRIFIVSPTRALANDLYRRILGPLTEIGIAVGRWTGDAHDGGRLQTVTVLTPEGMDSRLSRAGEVMSGVRALILDELHVVDCTARGDQLRILVERLRHRARDVQVAAASATVPEPEAMANRYLRDPVLVSAGARRKLLARVAVVHGPAQISAELSREVERGFRKVLAFANRREDVEVLSQAMRKRHPFGDAVYAHHGSLSRNERLRVERQFLSRPAALCVATSTLELGIDIGDIDLVVLLGAPPNVASLLQRAGRGGRRTSRNAVLALVKTPFERVVVNELLRAQAEGDYLEDHYRFRPGVLVQQALSLLHENPRKRISSKLLRSRLPPDAHEAWPEARLEEVLADMAKHDWLQAGCAGTKGRLWTLGERGERLWARAALHANIGEKQGVAVRDALTGDTVGHLSLVDANEFRLAGRGRQILTQSADHVVTTEALGSQPARFAGGPRPVVSRVLATRILNAAELQVPCRAWVGASALFHGLGTAGGALVGAVFRRAGCEVVRGGPLAVLLRSNPGQWPSSKDVVKALGKHHDAMARALAMGAFHRWLPAAERRRAVDAMIDIRAVEAFFERGCPSEISSELASDAARW